MLLLIPILYQSNSNAMKCFIFTFIIAVLRSFSSLAAYFPMFSCWCIIREVASGVQRVPVHPPGSPWPREDAVILWYRYKRDLQPTELLLSARCPSLSQDPNTSWGLLERADAADQELMGFGDHWAPSLMNPSKKNLSYTSKRVEM